MFLGVFMALSGSFRLALQIFDDGDKRDLFRSTPARHLIQEYMELTDGASDGQLGVCFSDTGTVLAGETVTLNLIDGLTDDYGRTIVFTAVKLLVLRNNSKDADDVLWIGPGAAAPWLGFWSAAGDRSVCDAGTLTPAHPGLVGPLYSPRGLGEIETGVSDEIDIIETGGANDVSYSILIAGEGSVV